MNDEPKLTPQKKYYLKNKEKIYDHKKNLYNTDENYKEMMKKARHEYYLKNKEELNRKRVEKERLKKLNDEEYHEKTKKYHKEYKLKQKELNE